MANTSIGYVVLPGEAVPGMIRGEEGKKKKRQTAVRITVSSQQ